MSGAVEDIVAVAKPATVEESAVAVG